MGVVHEMSPCYCFLPHNYYFATITKMSCAIVEDSKERLLQRLLCGVRRGTEQFHVARILDLSVIVAQT
jgi:hypothetical protein